MIGSRTARRLAATAVTAAAVVLSTGVAAHAETTHVKDKASDVVRLANADDERGTVLGYQDSKASGVDVRTMRVKHGKKNVNIRLTFARLDPDALISLSIRVDGKRKPRHYVMSLDKKAYVLDDSFEDGCTVPVRSRFGDRGRVSITFKRSCLGNPEKIKVSGGVLLGDFVADDQPFVVDAISASKTRDISWTTWLKAG